ncbi:hypothetical protein PR048_023564 [Dryococelus australis]|uniref:Uncharacterized protein n=1 Tax=Dryococelus australis TaxID=614101 RepID=A0ABQ9GUE8_9NEOP|nr:hypothetical protein PR048_023564 [Dryococelus australis]
MAENGPSKIVLTEDSDDDEEEEDESGRKSTVGTQQMSTKLLDSQLEDPNYEPDTQDMLDLDDDNNEGPVTRDYQNNRLQPSRSRTSSKKLVAVKKGSKKGIFKHHGAVSTGVSKVTHFETRFSGEELIPNGTQIHPGQSVISGNQREIDYSSEDEAVNVRTRGKQKVLSECGGNECSENNPSIEEFVSGSKKDRVRIKFLNGQQSRRRILRKRIKI